MNDKHNTSKLLVSKLNLNSLCKNVVKSLIDVNYSDLDEELKEQLEVVFNKYFVPQALMEGYIKIYEEEFTLEHLTNLLTFFSSSTGREYLDKAHILYARGAELGLKIVEANKKQIKEDINKIFGE